MKVLLSTKFWRADSAMIVWLVFAVLLQAAAVAAQTDSRRPTSAKNYEFTNGNWFDGKQFRRRTFYAVNGLLSDKKPQKIDETVDLKNGFVIPPFADAHCHHFDNAYNVAQQTEMYLRDGVFYVKVQTDVRTRALAVRDKVNVPNGVDVAYAHGALTHTHGHGIEVYEALALNLYNEKYNANIAKIAASRIRDNDAYYIVDTRADLDAKWQRILDGKPDFLKIYLVKSEDYAEKAKNIPNIELGNIGVDPQLVPEIVRLAHAAGLRVSAHVDTITDYRIALNAGVDEMAHLPGYYPVSAADAKTTAQRGVWVVPAPFHNQYLSAAERLQRDDVLRRNLSLLNKYCVKIAFGSDRYGSTPVDDVTDIKSLNVFSNLELLKIWCEATPQTIFPARKIGFLKNGYEASFIVLDRDPLADFTAIKNINFRFKQGFVIDLPPKK